MKAMKMREMNSWKFMVLGFVCRPHADPMDPFKDEAIDESDKDQEEKHRVHDLAVREAIGHRGKR